MHHFACTFFVKLLKVFSVAAHMSSSDEHTVIFLKPNDHYLWRFAVLGMKKAFWVLCVGMFACTTLWSQFVGFKRRFISIMVHLCLISPCGARYLSFIGTSVFNFSVWCEVFICHRAIHSVSFLHFVQTSPVSIKLFQCRAFVENQLSKYSWFNVWTLVCSFDPFTHPRALPCSLDWLQFVLPFSWWMLFPFCASYKPDWISVFIH